MLLNAHNQGTWISFSSIIFVFTDVSLNRYAIEQKGHFTHVKSQKGEVPVSFVTFKFSLSIAAS